MIRVTWEWLGQGAALDLANTVTIESGVEHDLIPSPEEYRRWAQIEAGSIPQGSLRLLEMARPRLMSVRREVRSVLSAISAGQRPPRRAIHALNRVSRAAPTWVMLDPDELSVREESSAHAIARLLALYARSAIELIAKEDHRLRPCPAPSCGMFFVRRRPTQRWCSIPCGTRARVARHQRRRAGAEAEARGRP